MQHNRAYAALALALLAISGASSFAALYYYQLDMAQPSPSGSLSDIDGSVVNILNFDDQPSDAMPLITQILSQNSTGQSPNI